MKIAFISGASGEIGYATVEKFIENGYFVIGQYRFDKKSIDELTAKYPENFFGIKCDLQKIDEVNGMLNSIGNSFKHIDVVVNNAGTALYKLITETTESEWDTLFNVNMKSAYLITNHALKSMINNGKGKIVNVSSIWGQAGGSMEVAYSASKAALIGYTKALAKELAPSNINVNCVCPGVIDTKMNARLTDSDKKEIMSSTPLGRLGAAEEVAELIWFLSSDKSDFITGQIITVDGGFIL
ncbi:MAG: SDR family oxidoreductase [Clostridia bacterium]|nr:SDR family oxidoreductase [Clostridia bacterium]